MDKENDRQPDTANASSISRHCEAGQPERADDKNRIGRFQPQPKIMNIKWQPLENLCAAFSDPSAGIHCWIEDNDGTIRAGDSGPGETGVSRHPLEATGTIVATVCVEGQASAQCFSAFATLCKQAIEHQRTLHDMAAATARLWRQTNAMLRMAASTQLTLDPEHIVEGVVNSLKKATCFDRVVAVLRLPGDEEYTRLGDAPASRVPGCLLAPLEAAAQSDVVLTLDVEFDATAAAATRRASDFPQEAAVASLATEAECYGYLLAAFSADEPPSSEDCKLLAACAQILSVGIANSHTLRRAKEATRMQVESKLYETLAKTAPVGIFRIDSKKQDVLYTNRQWHHITGLTTRDANAATWVDHIHPDDRDAVVATWRQATAQDRPFRVQYRLVRSDGSVRWVLSQAVPERDGSRSIVSYIGSLTDMTELKQAEEEKEHLESQLRESQKMESLGVLAGGIAHDFNNILGAIIGSTELAIGKVDPDSRVHRNLERVLTGANRATELVRQILTFSHHQDVQTQATDLARVAEEVMTLARASIPTTIELSRDINESCPMVMADATQLHQIIMNLCTNAYHAIGKRGGTITVGIHPVDVRAGEAPTGVRLDAGQYVCLSVADTGCGMDDETKTRVFDPFFTTKAANEGTGLGLSVVHGIVTKHGGTITVDSQLGKGTTFRIYFPVCENAAAAEAEATDPPAGASGRVLLVDDETELLETAAEMLSELGYQVTAFTSSMEALEKFRAEPERFDVVVSDQTMPDLTGSDMFKEMAVVRPDIPFVVATGFSDTLSPSGARKLGLAGFIPKPYRARDLANAVAHALARG